MDDISFDGKFTARVLEEGVLRVSLGSISNTEELEMLRMFCEKLHELVRDTYTRHGKIKALVDLSSMSIYKPEAINLLVNILKKDEPFVAKTATFGAKAPVALAEEAVQALSGRENYRSFPSEKEARTWLLE